jgi:hypothetical protein
VRRIPLWGEVARDLTAQWQVFIPSYRPLISITPIGISPPGWRLDFAIPEPLQHPLTEAVISAASLGNPQASQSDFTADAARLQAKKATKILHRVHG